MGGLWHCFTPINDHDIINPVGNFWDSYETFMDYSVINHLPTGRISSILSSISHTDGYKSTYHHFYRRYQPFPVIGDLWHCFTHIKLVITPLSLEN